MNLPGPQEVRIDFHPFLDGFRCALSVTELFQLNQNLLEEIPHTVRRAGAHHIVLRDGLLQHGVHGSHIVTCESPIPAGFEHSQLQFGSITHHPLRRGSGDLAGHYFWAAARVPLRVPAAVGIKVTLIVQLAPAATELPQLLV